MANGDDAVSSIVKSKNKPQLPWRPFKDRPTGIWIDETVERIKQTAQPETIESLFRNHIPKDTKFRTSISSRSMAGSGRTATTHLAQCVLRTGS